MKKLGLLMIVFALFAGVSMVSAASDTEDIDISLDILSTLTLDCDPTVTMGAITGTGTSALTTNAATCTVITNNSTGYEMTWAASTANMINANGDTIAPIAAGTAATPVAWNSTMTANDSAWGVQASGVDVNGTFGAGYTGAAAAIPTTAEPFADRTTETDADGEDTTLTFLAEVGASHWQPTGTYTNTITITATTL